MIAATVFSFAIGHKSIIGICNFLPLLPVSFVWFPAGFAQWASLLCLVTWLKPSSLRSLSSRVAEVFSDLYHQMWQCQEPPQRIQWLSLCRQQPQFSLIIRNPVIIRNPMTRRKSWLPVQWNHVFPDGTVHKPLINNNSKTQRCN